MKLPSNLPYFNAKKTALLALLTALGLIVFLLENLLPPMFLPGAKPGLSNVFSLLALVVFSPIEGLTVILARTFLAALFVGNLSVLLYSFTAGVISMLVSAILLSFFKDKLSVLSVSIIAAVIHNMTQLLIYCLMTGTFAVFSYMPYLALCGILSGALVGVVVILTIKSIPMSEFQKLYH